jgi:xylulokinase
MDANHSETYALGIDLGTHGPKVGIVSSVGEVIGWEFEPAPFHLVGNGGAEQDPEEWWQAIIKATNRLIHRDLVPIEDIKAIGPSAQWSTIVAVDRAGQPLMNAITWMDSRGAPYNQKLISGFPSMDGYNLLKVFQFLYYNDSPPFLSGKDSLGHVLYIKNEHPDIYRKTDKFLEVKDFINLKLTGKVASSFETPVMFEILDIRNPNRIAYSPVLLRLAGLPREKFPDLKFATDRLGPLCAPAARQLGLLEQTPVIMGAPDVHVTAIGAGAVRSYVPSLYLGTSLFLTCHVPNKKVDLSNFISSWPAAIPGLYFIPQSSDWAGGSLDYFLENLVYPGDSFSSAPNPEDAFNRLAQAVESVPPGSGKVIFTPWLYGEMCPIPDSNARGSFFNFTPEITRSHLARAVMEGVAYNGRWILQNIEAFCQQRMDPINAVGGGAVSDTWLQIYADVFDRTIQRVKEPRLATLRGAALLALVGIGCLTFDQIPGLTQITDMYRPNPNHRAIYDELFREFVDFYKRNKQSFARLNGWSRA